MKKSNLSLTLTLGIILLLSACAKEGPSGGVGPAGPAYIGTIIGHVSLYDQYGIKVLSNLGQVKLFINSTTAYIYPDTLISPDNNTGAYSYGSIATGDYSISAADTGYGATLINNFQFVDGTLNKDIKLSAIPTFSVSVTTGVGAAYDSLLISCTADPQARSCIIFVNSNLVIGSLPNYYILSYVQTIPANATKVTALISKQELYNTGYFISGSMAYYAVYSYAVNDQSVYEDLATGQNVYNAVSNPQIDSAIVP